MNAAERIVNLHIATPNKTKRLKTLLSEFGDSLVRVDGERAHQTAIAERAENECQCNPKHFKKLATALHKNRARMTREDLEGQMNLFDLVLEEQS